MCGQDAGGLRAQIGSRPQAREAGATDPAELAAPFIDRSPLQLMAASAPEPSPLAIRWSGVPELSSADGSFRLRPRGRIYIDSSWTGGSEHRARNISGSEVRALWMGFEGQLNKFSYILTADFTNNEAAIRSAYVAWRGRTAAGEIELTLGNRLSEKGLEGSSSSEGAPFLERNAVALAISPQKGLYGMGLTAKLFGEGWHVAAQVAGDDINNKPDTSRETITTMARAHWNPVRGEAGAAHLGLWGFHEAFPSDVPRVTRNTFWGGAHFNDRLLVPMGGLDAPSEARAWGVELGGVGRRSWAFAEYGRRRIEARPLSATIEAWTVSAGWSLSGERPGYSPRGGAWVRARPERPLSEGGLGAVDLVARIQRLDNTDVASGGLGEEVTLGVNWKLEAWLRLMLDASLWRTRNVAGPYPGTDSGQTVNGRLQLSF